MQSNNSVGAYSNGIPPPTTTSEDLASKSKIHQTNHNNHDQLLPGEGNLWSSILDSVSNNREKSSLPTRKVIVLGERNSGKSTLVSYLSASNPSSSDSTSNAATLIPSPAEGVDGQVDMGTSYTTVEIGDDGDDDALARLSLHQIPSALPPYSNLLPLILNADSLRESLILVLIPFTHPHSLLTSLVRWLVLIQSVIKSIKESIKPSEGSQPALRGEYIIEESKEALEHQYRSYSEPIGASQNQTQSSLSPTSTSNAELVVNEGNSNNIIHLDLPLPPGTLTENMGIGIVVVCTKSDQIDQLEKEKDFKEEQFDFIQQVLRSICLRFGGALFFTSDKKPETLLRLRSYVLHRLFGQLITSSTSTTNLTTTTTTTTTTMTTTSGGNTGMVTNTTTTNARLFQFPHKANVVDRDEVLVPMGWDSWGKIKILRDGFDPLVVGNGWLFDLERPSRRQLLTKTDQLEPSHHQTTHSTNEEDDQVGYDSEGRKIVSACKLWEDMIGETDDDIPLINLHDRVIVTEEQEFLKAKYEVIKKERDLDPRSHFQLNTKGLSTPQAIKFTNGTILSADNHHHHHNVLSLNNGSGGGSNTGITSTTGVEEEMNAQLNKFSLRDSQGISNGRSINSGLSPVEILHLQQQQQQMNQTPRNSYTSSSNSAMNMNLSTSKTMMMPTSSSNQKMMMMNSMVTSPLSARSNSSSSNSSSSQQLPSQSSILLNRLNPGLPPPSTGSNPGDKAMLANFFGKLLDKDSSGARGLTSSHSTSNLNLNPALTNSNSISTLNSNPNPFQVMPTTPSHSSSNPQPQFSNSSSFSSSSVSASMNPNANAINPNPNPDPNLRRNSSSNLSSTSQS